MAENKKQSLIEEALNEINQLNESMKSNTKEILRSIAIEEINGVVNESLNEDFDNEDEDFSDDAEAGDELDVDTPSADAEENDVDAESGEAEEVEFDADTEDAIAVSDEEGSEEGSEDYAEEEEDTDFEYDFTNASDDEVIAVFKKLSNDDEFEIISDKEVHIKDPESGSEYQVKFNEKEEAIEAPVADMDSPVETGIEDEAPVGDVETSIDTEVSDDEDVEYEVEFDDEEEEEVEEGVNEDIVRGAGHDTHVSGGSMPSGDIEGQKAPIDSDSGDNLEGGFDDDAVSHANAEGPMVMEDEDEEINEEELDESIPVGNAEARRVPGKNTPIKGAGAKSISEAKYNKLKEGYDALVKENGEFKSALKQFRQMLSEVGVYNTNLTYATKIFTEQSTTQEEKKNILKRFDDEATTIKESKKVYKSVLESLNKKPTIQESVGNKLNNDNLASSKSQINETTAYEDASTVKMRKLMGL